MLRFIHEAGRVWGSRLVRIPGGIRLLGWMIRMMSLFTPEQRLIETGTLLAFNHPTPSYQVHIVIVPKTPYRDLMELSAQDQGFLTDLISSVQELVRRFNLEKKGWRLITNGGKFQDFPYLHFHFIAESIPDFKD
jgi:histidine triad (HIT) family protein